MAIHRGEEGVGAAGGVGSFAAAANDARRGSAFAVVSTTGSKRSTSSYKRGVDVDVANLEKRLGAVFEYLRYFTPPGGHGGAEEQLEEEVRAVVSSAVKDAMEAARGGFHDARALVLGALFFAWVKDMPSVAVPCDPFLAHSRWKLSTDLFVSLVKDAGLEADLRRQLQNIPEHASRKLTVALDGAFSFPGIPDDEAHQQFVSSEKSGGGLPPPHGVPNVSPGGVGDRLMSAPPVAAAPHHTFRGEAWSQCKQSVSRWRRLNISSSSNDNGDVASAVDSVRRAVQECALGGRLTGSMLLCSSGYHAARSAMRMTDKSRRAAAEHELIAIMNRITGGASWPLGANEQGQGNTSSSSAAAAEVGNNNIVLAAEILSPLLTAPQMTLSRLVHIAAKHSSQAPFLLSAFSAQPGVARLQLAPSEPPLILTALARMLRNPPSELRGLNQLAGIKNFAVALLPQKQSVLPTRVGEPAAAREAKEVGVGFGQRLAIPRRSHLDAREALLVTVLPALSTASFWQTNFGNEKDAGSGEGEFRALEILCSLLIGDGANAADFADVTASATTGLKEDFPLSPSGIKLLKATFPGGFLLALASYVDSRGADRIGFSSPVDGSSALGSNLDAIASRVAPERTRDLATSLLLSCVKALDGSLFNGCQVSTAAVKGSASVLTSLAAADAAAATQISWHTRLLLEPVMGKARKLHPDPLRTAPPAPAPEGRGFGWVVETTAALRDDNTGGVARVAVAFADVIRLCSIRALRASDVMDHIRGWQQQQEQQQHAAVPDGGKGLEPPLGTKAVLDGIATAIRENAESPSTLRSGLLMACVMTLPTCTMKEFGIVLRGFLPQVLLLISKGGGSASEEESKSHSGGGGGITPPSSTIGIAQLLVDLLTRVFLMHVSSITRRETKHNHINILARQLATAAVVTDNQRLSSATASFVEAGKHESTSIPSPPEEKQTETSYVLAAAGVFHSLKCVSAALLWVAALPDGFRASSARSEAILSAAVLKLVGALSGLGLQPEVLNIFHNYPEGNVKSQVKAACL